MAYICELGTGQTVYLDNQGSQTQLVVSLHSRGQQQQSSSSFQTGAWLAPPVAFQIHQGLLIKITVAQGESYIQVQGTSVSLIAEGADTSGMAAIAMQQAEIPHTTSTGMNATPIPDMPEMKPMQPMQPMQPMKPMQPIQPMQPIGGLKMGNMQMSMNPMQMSMGNMQMAIGSPPTEGPQRKFCSQCGGAIALSDCFCSGCGNKLQ